MYITQSKWKTLVHYKEKTLDGKGGDLFCDMSCSVLQAELFADKNHGGRAFYSEAVLSAAGVPQIAAVCGSCTAGGN